MADLNNSTVTLASPAGSLRTLSDGTNVYNGTVLLDSTGALLKVISVKAPPIMVSQTLTRPANTTAYATGQAIGGNTSSGAASVISFAATIAAGFINSCRLVTNSTNLTNAAFRLHLYTASPTSPAADAVALNIVNADALVRIGYFDIAGGIALADGAEFYGVPGAPNLPFAIGSGTTLYGLLEARGAYTPGSGETFAIQIGLTQ